MIRQTQETFQRGKSWFQVLAIFSASLAAFNAAALFYWTSPSIPIILESDVYNTTIDEASYLAVIPPIAMVIGSPFYTGLMDVIGRKYLILSMAVLHLTAWILIVVSRSMLYLFISRFIYGLADACLFGVIPIYIGEISTPQVRNSYGNLIMILIFAAQFLVNAVGYFCSLTTTAFIFMVFPIIFFFMFGMMPETPYCELIRKRDQRALNSLKRLRQMRDVEVEFAQIKTDVKRQMSERGTWKELFASSTNRRAIAVCASIRAIQQFSGVSAFAIYTQYIFDGAVNGLNRGQAALIYTGMMATMNLFGSVVLNKLGRRKAMVLSSAGCALTLFIEAAYFYFQQTDAMSGFTWIPLVGLCGYVIFFTTGLSTVPTVILGELFSASIKSKATCIMNVTFAVLIGLSTKCFQLLSSGYGLFVPFAAFGLCSFAGIFVSWYIVPETKGRTLEEIQQKLQKQRN